MADLKRNVEKLSEHRLRLFTLGFRPLPPHKERELFPNPDVAIYTEAEYEEVLRDWNQHYPKGRKDNPIDVPPKKTLIKTIRNAYSPIKRLKQLARRTKRDLNNGKQPQSQTQRPNLQKRAKETVSSISPKIVHRNGNAKAGVRHRRRRSRR